MDKKISKYNSFSPFRVSAIYVVVAALWILLSDQAVDFLFSGTKMLTSVQTLKGWFFVVFTGSYLYLILLRLQNRIEKETTERKQVMEVLRESEFNYRMLFESNPHPMWVYELESLSFLDVNLASCKKYGYTKEEFLELTLVDIRPTEDTDALLKNIKSSEDQLQRSGIWRHKLRDGTIIFVEILSHGIKFNNRDARLVLANDVTERTLAETHIRKLNRVYSLLSDINQTIVRERDLDVLFQSMCRTAVQKGEFLFCWIGMWDNNTFKIKSYEGKSNVLANQIESYINSIPQVEFDSVFRGEPLIENFFDDENPRGINERLAVLIGSNSFAVFPIVSGTMVKGLVAFYAMESNFFDSEEIRLIDELTSDISFAMEFDQKEKSRQAAEEALRLSEHRFRKMVEFGSDIIVLRNSEGKPLYVSDSAEKLTGFTVEEYLNLSFEEIIHPADLPELRTIFNELIKTEAAHQNIVVRGRHKNGSYHWYEVYLTNLLHDPAVKAVVLNARDITDRKSVEEKIIENENRFRRAIEEAGYPVAIHSEDGVIHAISRGWLEITGYSFNEISTISSWTEKAYGVKKDSVRADIIKLLHIKGSVDEGEYEVRCKDGRKRIWHFTSSSLGKMSDGKINIISMATDVTDQSEIKDQLIKAKEYAEQSNKLKDAFIANISHEIRTPLNGLLGMTSLIRSSLSKHISSHEEEFFEGIKRASKRIIRTVDMILTFSRLQVGDIEIKKDVLDVDSILNDLYHEFMLKARDKSLQFEYDNKAGSVEVIGDDFSFTNAISNVIENAIKYTNKGYVKIVLFNHEGRNHINIEDSGIGISEEYLKQIFNPYSQEESGYNRGYEGVGLGLSIVQEYLKLNNFDIKVESKKGKGTIFTISL